MLRVQRNMQLDLISRARNRMLLRDVDTMFDRFIRETRWNAQTVLNSLMAARAPMSSNFQGVHLRHALKELRISRRKNIAEEVQYSFYQSLPDGYPVSYHDNDDLLEAVWLQNIAVPHFNEVHDALFWFPRTSMPMP